MSEPQYTEREWRERMEREKEREERIEREYARELKHDLRYGYYKYVGTDHEQVWVPPSDKYADTGE